MSQDLDNIQQNAVFGARSSAPCCWHLDTIQQAAMVNAMEQSGMLPSPRYHPAVRKDQCW